MNEKATDPPRGDPVGGSSGDGDSGSHLGSRDMELDFLDSRLSPETRELLALCRALCRRRYMGLPDVLYAPMPAICELMSGIRRLRSVAMGGKEE